MKTIISKLPTTGDRRIRSRFLITPLTLNSEQRWLERASWEEVYRFVSPRQMMSAGEYKWVPKAWVDPSNLPDVSIPEPKPRRYLVPAQTK